MKNKDFIYSLPTNSFVLTGSYALALQDKEFAKYREPRDIDICITQEYGEFIKYKAEKMGGVCEDAVVNEDYHGADWFLSKIIFDDGSQIDVLLHETKTIIKAQEPGFSREYNTIPLKDILKYKVEIIKSTPNEESQLKHMQDLMFFLKNGKITIF